MPDKICKSCKSSVDDVSYFCPHCGEALFEDSAAENPFRREPVDENIAGRLPSAQDLAAFTKIIEHEPQSPSPQDGATMRTPSGVVPPRPVPPGVYAQQGPTKTQQPHARGPMGRTPARQAVPTQSPAPSPINRGAYYQSAATPGMVSQPQNIAAGTAAGQGYTREQLRRLIEEDRRKKKRLMLLGIPGLLVVGSIVTLLLLLFVFSGLSPAEYKKQALLVHADVMKAIDGNEVNWEIDYNADSYSSLCATIDANMEASLTTIETAKSTVSELKPPKEVMQLNRDLLIFYDNAESYVQREQAVFAFGKEWSAIWQEWVDTPYATDKLNDVSTAAEAVALFDQDIATIDSFTSRLRAINPPPECKNMSDETISKLQEERVLLDRLKRAQINYDVAAYNAAANDYDYFYQNTSSAMDALLDDLIDFYMEGAGLTERGKSLELQLGGTLDSETEQQALVYPAMPLRA